MKGEKSNYYLSINNLTSGITFQRTMQAFDSSIACVGCVLGKNLKQLMSLQWM